jgi:hypothetical protein
MRDAPAGVDSLRGQSRSTRTCPLRGSTARMLVGDPPYLFAETHP